MDESSRKFKVPAATYCRTVGLHTFIVLLILASQTGRSDDWRPPVGFPNSARTLPRGVGQLIRLPPINQLPNDQTGGETVGGPNATQETLARQPSNLQASFSDSEQYDDDPALRPLESWFDQIVVGYDHGFVIASGADLDLHASDAPFVMRLNGWGQVRHTFFDSDGANPDINQIQLKRARIIFSGNAFTSALGYFVQLDGRSSSGDDMRLLDYYLTFDFGRYLWGLKRDAIAFKTGKYKMPFSAARYLSGREFEFTDRSVASMFFDVNRSLAVGMYGKNRICTMPLQWEVAVFNGLVTGGAETGSSGSLDTNFAYSGHVFAYPIGEWGDSGLADLGYHKTPAVRAGAGFASTTIEKSGRTEFDRIRVVDSGATLASILPPEVEAYSVSLFSIDASLKFRGLSFTTEYYFRNTGGFKGTALPLLFDRGFWMQAGYFVIPEKVELLARWSRVNGNSGTLGVTTESFDEVAGGLVWYINGQHAKFTLDVTHLNGAPIDSASLDIAPGDIGWLFRSQIQFSF